jgi:hypothetical protein
VTTPVRSSATGAAPNTIELLAWPPTAPDHTDSTSIRGSILAKEIERGCSTATATPIPSVDANALVTPPNVYSSILVHPLEAPLLRAGFEGLKTILNLIDKSSSIFPPLKSAASGLLGAIDVIQVRPNIIP